MCEIRIKQIKKKRRDVISYLFVSLRLQMLSYETHIVVSKNQTLVYFLLVQKRSKYGEKEGMTDGNNFHLKKCNCL